MGSTLDPWVAVIPLRAGSKGLPQKNIRLLGDKPLYRHAVDQALNAGASRVLISTDIPEVLQAQHDGRVQVFQRPDILCGDAVPMAPVLEAVLIAAAHIGAFVLLQATSPLRRESHIASALRLYASGDFGLVMSVTTADAGILKYGIVQGNVFHAVSDPAYCFANRQTLPTVVRPNGAIYVADTQRLLDTHTLVSERIGAVQMEPQDSFDIDSLDDFERCAAILAERQGIFSA